MILSVDPGIRGCGAALWENQCLVRAAYVPSSAREGDGPVEAVAMAQALVSWAQRTTCEPRPIGDLVVEWPRTYGGKASRGDANDLFALAGIDSALAALLPQSTRVSRYFPKDWKGTIEKPKTTKQPYIIRERVFARLDVFERAVVDWTNNVKHSWDVADAIGIGLKHLGRFRLNRVYAVE